MNAWTRKPYGITFHARRDSDNPARRDNPAMDFRQIGLGAQILADLGVRQMRVMSNRRKYHAISGFGLEVVESARKRWFMERTTASRAFFPSEPDLGARLSGQAGWFRYALAVMNGEPLGTKNGYPGQDPNLNKDIVLRVGAASNVTDRVAFSGGVSLLDGQGFHRGAPATKNGVAWRAVSDLNRAEMLELQGLL